jgi:hypothetical protein
MLSDEAALRILRNGASGRVRATVGDEPARVVAAAGAHEGAEVWPEVRVPADYRPARGDAVDVAVEGRSLVASPQTRHEVGKPSSRSAPDTAQVRP